MPANLMGGPRALLKGLVGDNGSGSEFGFGFGFKGLVGHDASKQAEHDEPPARGVVSRLDLLHRLRRKRLGDLVGRTCDA